MRKNFHLARLCCAALLFLLIPATSFAADSTNSSDSTSGSTAAPTNIQMLPPEWYGTATPCAGAAGTTQFQILAYSADNIAGHSGINCISGFTVDSGGTLTAAGGANIGNGSVVVYPTGDWGLIVRHRMISGNQDTGGDGGLAVGPNQFFGSKDAGTMGLYDGNWDFTLSGGNASVTGNLTAGGNIIAQTYGIPDAEGAIDKDAMSSVHSLATLPACDTRNSVVTKVDGIHFGCTPKSNFGEIYTTDGSCMPAGFCTCIYRNPLSGWCGCDAPFRPYLVAGTPAIIGRVSPTATYLCAP